MAFPARRSSSRERPAVSGAKRAFAFADRGARLELVDIDRDGLERTALLCGEMGLSFDLGELEAKRNGRTSQQSGAVWALIGVKGRADLRLSRAWMLTGDFGAIFPLTRYDLVAATGESLYYAEARFGASASLGVELRLP